MKKRCGKGAYVFPVELLKQIQQRSPEYVRAPRSMLSLSADACHQPIKSEIIDLAKMFSDDAASITRIDFQWIKLHYTTTHSGQNPLIFCAFRHKLPHTRKLLETTLLKIFLSWLLLHSNADMGRIFSRMNIIKTKLCNRLGIRSLNAIVAIKYGL